MQVVLSQRQSTEFAGPPINLYRSLRSLNPSPYMYFMNMGDFILLGHPQKFSSDSKRVKSRFGLLQAPDQEARIGDADIALEKELLADPKELGQHLMLIDLAAMM